MESRREMLKRRLAEAEARNEDLLQKLETEKHKTKLKRLIAEAETRSKDLIQILETEQKKAKLKRQLVDAENRNEDLLRKLDTEKEKRKLKRLLMEAENKNEDLLHKLEIERQKSKIPYIMKRRIAEAETRNKDLLQKLETEKQRKELNRRIAEAEIRHGNLLQELEKDKRKIENDANDQINFSKDKASFLGMKKGFIFRSPEIPEVALHCSQHCFADDPGVLLERLIGEGRTKEEDILESYLQNEKLEVHIGAGKVEKLAFDDANRRYMSLYFQDLEETAYCYPPVFEFKHPGEAFDLDERGNVRPSPRWEVPVDTLHRERRGELPEERTVTMFSTMLRKYGIPSFIIHGYNWKKEYVNVLRSLNNKAISKLLSKVFKKEGEIDLLISLPTKCLLSLEVKAVDKQHGVKEIVKVVSKAFSQCLKISEFLSKMKKFKTPVCLIKVVALPNCTRATVDKLFCMICRAHIVTDDELSNVTKLKSWFEALMSQYSLQIENSSLLLPSHLDIIARLIGPASLSGSNPTAESIQRTTEQIEKHGGLKNVRQIMRWNQLTPQQLHVQWKDPKFLLLFGPPGSGKTLLALSKAKEILKDNSETGSVLYILVTNYSFGLMHMYKDELSKVEYGNCQFFINEYNIEGSLSEEFSKLLGLIITLKKKHQNQTLHVICDEFKSPALLVENSLIGMEGVGYVWLLVDPLFDVPPERQKEYRLLVHGFEVVFLDWVMRMSRQNIEFANAVIQFTLRSKKDSVIEIPLLRAGHAINGERPIVYRMKCVCQVSEDSFTCSRCTYIRINWLLIKACSDLGFDLMGISDKDLPDVGLSLIDLHNVVLKDESTAMLHYISYKGYEHKVIIINLSDLLDFYKLFIGLTRSLGKIIILDSGCLPTDIPKYERFINAITENVELTEEVKEVKPNEEDLLLMRELRILQLGEKIIKASMLMD